MGAGDFAGRGSMGFEWDAAQGAWLSRRLAGKAARYEEKIEVAGSALEIDAAAEDVGTDDFFDFLTRISVFENKAPGERVDEDELLLVSARTLLLVRKWRLGLSSLQEITQVVICSRLSRKLRGELGGKAIRGGIFETRLVTRLVIVEADRLPVTHANLSVLVRYASIPRVRSAIAKIVEQDLREHYAVLWVLRRELFREVLVMKGKTVAAKEIDLKAAIEDIGIRNVVDSVGLESVIEAVGLESVIEAVGLESVIEAVGLEKVVETVGVKALRRKLDEIEKRDRRSR